MRFVFLLLLVLTSEVANCQTFLEEYQKYLNKRIDTHRSGRKIRKILKNNIKSEIAELDTIFKQHKSRTGFDFNTADTLFLVYEAPLESLFTNDVVIFSGKDTISYSQDFERVGSFEYKRRVTFVVPDANAYNPERDSLNTLLARRDFNAIALLGEEQAFLDGTKTSIYVAFRDRGRYQFDAYFPKQFYTPRTYKNE